MTGSLGGRVSQDEHLKVRPQQFDKFDLSKVGHAGTLDPLATGLLIVCTGKFTKRISEIVVKELCDNYLILRPSALLGNEMKKNTFQKIIAGEDIALTPNTVMNYILYEDVLDAIHNNYNGEKIAIVFGGEASGLTNEHLSLVSKCVTINTHSNFSSLNLSHAVSVFCYSLFFK